MSSSNLRNDRPPEIRHARQLHHAFVNSSSKMTLLPRVGKFVTAKRSAISFPRSVRVFVHLRDTFVCAILAFLPVPATIYQLSAKRRGDKDSTHIAKAIPIITMTSITHPTINPTLALPKNPSTLASPLGSGSTNSSFLPVSTSRLGGSAGS